ncbi:hypothetical protein [Spongiimicrobium sp. 3-5]|uniref:hypothetical protein n=1 Tax=Spongiimicrobium sp. 3-5 TaxID=3332596 RepID=UPI0039810037
MERSNKEVALLIKHVIDYLKSKKISQQDIESRINYTSLSKAKNLDKYPQPVIEKKTRAELLALLFEEFSLFYNEANERVESMEGATIKTNLSDVQYFIMHYYAFARGVVDRALVQVVNKRKVIMDYRIQEHWEGTYNVVENYTFIEVTKMGYATPVKKLLSLFSGTMKYGHNYLLGTYSTVKRDGFPAAGRVILEKAKTKTEADLILNRDSDYRIVGYLKDNVYLTKLSTPKDLDDIVSTHHNHYLKLVGAYKFIIPTKQNSWSMTELIIKKDFSAYMEINDVQYDGYASFININVLNLKFTRKKQDSISIRKQILNMHINVRRTSDNHVYTCAASSPIIHGEPSAFSAYLVLHSNFKKKLLDNLEQRIFLAKPLD